MCGEHPSESDFLKTNRGSSPHVRGAPEQTQAQVEVTGIIPACAGSTKT